SSISFSVDESLPTLSIDAPLNASYGGSVLFNVSSSEEGTGFIVPNLDGDLVSWWRMDDVNGSGDVVDYMGLNNGTVTSAVQVDDGKFGKGFYFDGSSYVNTPFNGTEYENLSFSFWAKTDELPTVGNRYIMDNSPGSVGYIIRMDNAASSMTAYGYYASGGLQSPSAITIPDTDWHYYVVTMNSTAVGISMDNGAFNYDTFSSDSLAASNDLMVFGGEYTGGNRWNGSIDEIAIFSKVLTADEILALYNATRLSHTETVADGNHNYTAYTSDTAGNVNSSSISFSVDGILPLVTIDAPLNVSYGDGSSILFNVSSSEEGTGFIVPNLDGKLVGWWRMDDVNGSGDVVDYMGVNNGSAIADAVQVDGGKFGKGFEFEGDDDYIDLNKKIIDTPASFSAFAWVYHKEDGYDAIISQDNAGRDWFIAALNNDFRFRIYNTIGGSFENTTSSDTIPLNTWTHVGIRVDNSSKTIEGYVNGARVSSMVYTGILETTEATGTHIGRTLSDSYVWNGTLDEVMIFNKSLTDDEVWALYNATRLSHTEVVAEGNHNYTAYSSDVAGNVNSSSFSFSVDEILPSLSIDAPLNVSYANNSVLFNVSSSEEGTGFMVPKLDGNLLAWFRMDDVNGSGDLVDYIGNGYGIAVGDAVQTDGGKFGKGFSFDGAGDYIDAGNGESLNITSGNIAISTWIKFTNTVGYGWIVSKSAGGVGGYELFRNGGSGAIRFSVGDGTGSTGDPYFDIWTTPEYDDGNWHHIVGNYESGVNASLYVDGALVLTESYTPSANILPASSNLFIGGRGAAGGSPFNGSIDETMIFNKSLTADEILALYNATRLSHTEVVSEGNHNYTAYTSDTAGNVNSSSISFNIDETSPSLSLVSPLNLSYANSSVLFNVSSSEEGTGFIVPNLDGSLVSWFRMDDVNGSGDVVDYLGVNNGTALNGAVQVDNGKFGKGFKFVGNGSVGGDHIDLGTDIINGSENFTISAWINMSQFLPGNEEIVSQGENISLEFSINGELIYESLQTSTATAVNALTAKSWNHVAVTYNGTEVTLYVDGNNSASGVKSMPNSVSNTLIGNFQSSNGIVDEVMFFNKSLTGDEIMSLYNATRLSHTEVVNEGSHNYTIYGSDAVGNINSSSISFNIDETLPSVSIVYPQNSSYNVNVSELNYTVSESGGSCWYSNSSGVWNSSVVNAGVNFTKVVSVVDGNEWTLYCNDSVGNKNSTSVSFFKDVTNPVITIGDGTLPFAAAPVRDFIYVNVSVVEDNEDSIRFILYNSSEDIINNSFYSDGTRTINWTNLSAGTYYLGVLVNDTSGNLDQYQNYIMNFWYLITTNITNCDELELINENVTINYTLNNDVDCSGVSFTPIGISPPFVGGFNGNNYSVLNLRMTGTSADYRGLFGYVGVGGVVQDVNVLNASISGDDRIAGVVGENSGSVINCYSNGSVNGDKDTGGLVGRNYGIITNSNSDSAITTRDDGAGGLVGQNDGNITNCYSNTSFTAIIDAGGLVGQNNGNIWNSSATGNVTSSGSYMGGLAGFNNGEIINCFATGDIVGNVYVGGLVGDNNANIVNCSATGYVSGSNYIGGLVGENSANISNSFATGNFNSTGSGNTGGLVGYNNYGNIENSYATGSISTMRSFIGGLVGTNYGNINDSFATGNIISSTSYIGGLVGQSSGNVSNSFSTGNSEGFLDVGGFIGNNIGSISNVYWYNSSGNPADCWANSTGNYSEGCTAIDDINYFKGDVYSANAPMSSWSFFSIWEEVVGDYPHLVWENFAGAGNLSTPQVSYGVGTLGDGARAYQDFIYVSVSFTTNDFANVTFNLYNSTGDSVNSTSYLTETYNINWAGLSSDIYYYNATVFDSSGASNSTDTYNVTLVADSTNITLNSGWNLIALNLSGGSSGADRNISLSSGWNLLGVSSDSNLSFSGLTFTNDSGTSGSWTGSVNDNQVNAYSVYYDNPSDAVGKYKYSSASALSMDDSSLRGQKGYWVYANKSGNLTLSSAGGVAVGVTYNWADLRFSNGTSNLNITDAGDEGWVTTTLQYWDPAEGGFDTICASTGPPYFCDRTTILSWEGTFVYSNQNNVVMIREN
ncbi:LamG domain-containing protein, partial [archaeon]|nr:LamG domain-containing protein [archaeon]MBT4241412.1 LamG domain-containing protein [archaeon]MBT4418233.1 LamG domain-containing protein [archaeon]